MLKAANQVLQDPLKYIVVPILFFLYNLLLLTYGSLFEPWMVVYKLSYIL